MSGEPSTPRSAVVVVVDRLGAGFLGPYGNTWLDTPQFNRLASRSLLCETAWPDSLDVAGACRAWWTGQHALEPATDLRLPLPQAARDAGLNTVLVTDDPEVVELSDTATFARRVAVPAAPCDRAANALEETAVGRLFVAAIDELTNLREPTLLWIHSRGMAGPWDAPSALRQQFADEDDPVAPDFIEPPIRCLPEDFDPDELLGIVHAYAGQVALVDACLGSLLDALDESLLAEQTLLAVTSLRGYPLGEHRQVGGSELFSELVNVPLLVQRPAGKDALARFQGLVQPPDLHATLAEWLGIQRPVPSMFAKSLLADISARWLRRELICACGKQQRAVRTRAWMLREVIADDETGHQLFAKPDDRWEVNEVSSRCGDIAEQLAAAADQFRRAAADGAFASLAPLAQALTNTRR